MNVLFDKVLWGGDKKTTEVSYNSLYNFVFLERKPSGNLRMVRGSSHRTTDEDGNEIKLDLMLASDFIRTLNYGLA